LDIDKRTIFLRLINREYNGKRGRTGEQRETKTMMEKEKEPRVSKLGDPVDSHLVKSEEIVKKGRSHGKRGIRKTSAKTYRDL